MTYWTLEYAGTEATFETWGLTGLQLTFRSQGMDEASFVSEAQQVHEAALFASRAIVKIRSDRVKDANTGAFSGGTQRFYGLMDKVTRSGNGQTETLNYRLVGPTWWLENLAFEQYRRYYAGAAGSHDAGEYYTWDAVNEVWTGTGPYINLGTADYNRILHTTVVLNQDEMGELQTVAEQIEEILKFVIAAGASFTYSPSELVTEFGSVQLPTNERPDTTCDAALATVLSWIPDCETWFDHSTDPPTFHVKRRTNLTALSLSAVAGTQIDSLQIEDRDELRRAQVEITYKRPVEADGLSFIQTFKDTWPASPSDTSRFSKLRETVDLGGFVGSTRSAEIETVAAPATSGAFATDTGWWKGKEPWLNDWTISSISDVVVTGTLYARELTNGMVQEWMDVGQSDVSVTAIAHVTNTRGDVRDVPLSARYVATDAVTKTYSQVVVDQYAEEVPGWDTVNLVWIEALRLSKIIWTALDQPQYEGSFTLVSDEPLFTVVDSVDGTTKSCVLGSKVSLTGPNELGVFAEWKDMAMPIKQVSVDVDNGKTTVNFGPNRYWTSGELVDLMRVTRVRVVTSMTTNRAEGIPGSDPGATQKVAKDQSSAGGELHQVVVAKGPVTAGAYPVVKSDARSNPTIIIQKVTAAGGGVVAEGQILLSLSEAAGKDIRLREHRFYDKADSCKLKARLFLCSEVYTPTTT